MEQRDASSRIVGAMDKKELLNAAAEALDGVVDPKTNAPLTVALLRSRAEALRCTGALAAWLDERTKRDTREQWRVDIEDRLERARDGSPKPTITNFTTIFALDPYFDGLRFNELKQMAEHPDKHGKLKTWNDFDDADAIIHIGNEYKIQNEQAYRYTFMACVNARRYNPAKDLLLSLKWDGTPRITKLLTTWMGAEDSPYTDEVSRLIFAGGVHRLFDPGCKFDDMPVLIGGQGAGKSTFVRWLAIEDRFFNELTTINGKEGIESIEGSWIVEVSELLAVTSAKAQEAVKSYLSRLKDKYRRAYGRRVEECPRTCIFIATSNKEQFIADKTGGRRFYPVKCSGSGYDLYDHEKECRAYIRQCWAEATSAYFSDDPQRREFMRPVADGSIQESIREHQADATEDDIREGLIRRYLENTHYTRVCIGMLWDQALHIEGKPPDRADQIQLGLIMQNVPGWEKAKSHFDFGQQYGKQRYWRKIEEPSEVPDGLPF